MRKRFLACVCALLSAVCLTVSALAAEIYADIEALYQHWSVTTMPEWVCSVTSTDGTLGRLTVTVNSQAAVEQLAAMVEDESTMTVIVSADAYTHAELMKVKEEIVDKYMMNAAATSPIVSVGVGWASIDGVVTGFGESGRESRVVVGVLEQYAEEYREIFRKQYGDMVYVKASGEVGVTGSALGVVEDAVGSVAIERIGAPALYIGGAALLLIAAAVFLVLRKRRKR